MSLKGWFKDCTTMEELNKERQRLISVINTEYGEQRQIIMSRIPPYKTIPIIAAADVETPESITYVPFPKSESHTAPETHFIFLPTGEVVI